MGRATVIGISHNAVRFVMETDDQVLVVGDSNGVWTPAKGCVLLGAVSSYGGQTLGIAGTTQTADVFIESVGCSPAQARVLLGK